jgi:hypothetical protein
VGIDAKLPLIKGRRVLKGEVPSNFLDKDWGKRSQLWALKAERM